MAHQEDWPAGGPKPRADYPGAVAQLGEHLLCMQRVRSSNLLGSTRISRRVLQPGAGMRYSSCWSLNDTARGTRPELTQMRVDRLS